MSSIPVVMCARTRKDLGELTLNKMGQAFSAALAPEMEVIHSCESYETAQSELPSIMAGSAPSTTAAPAIGTHKYDQQPRAILFSQFEKDEVENLIKNSPAKETCIWMMRDPSKVPTGAPPPDYAQQVTKDIKAAFQQWMDGGAKEGGIIVY